MKKTKLHKGRVPKTGFDWTTFATFFVVFWAFFLTGMAQTQIGLKSVDVSFWAWPSPGTLSIVKDLRLCARHKARTLEIVVNLALGGNFFEDPSRI